MQVLQVVELEFGQAGSLPAHQQKREQQVELQSAQVFPDKFTKTGKCTAN